MSDDTQILAQFHASDPEAAAKLLPQVHDELRKLLAAGLAQKIPGHTRQAMVTGPTGAWRHWL